MTRVDFPCEKAAFTWFLNEELEMCPKHSALGLTLAVAVLIATAFVWAEGPAGEDLSDKKPVSIDSQVAKLKLKEVATFQDNLSTQTTIQFSGKAGDYEVRPGTDVLVELAEAVRVFRFAPVGFRPERIGGEDDDHPLFHYVRLEWNLDGPVRWTMYALPPKEGAV